MSDRFLDPTDFEDDARAFVENYYQVFDNDRPALHKFYRDNSMLLFDTTPAQGAASITEKLTNLPFRKIQHRIHGCDVQPSNEQGGLMVLITGSLLWEAGKEPTLYFIQSFQLLPEGDSYFIFNDIFRVNYAAQQARSNS